MEREEAAEKNVIELARELIFLSGSGGSWDFLVEERLKRGEIRLGEKIPGLVRDPNYGGDFLYRGNKEYAQVINLVRQGCATYRFVRAFNLGKEVDESTDLAEEKKKKFSGHLGSCQRCKCLLAYARKINQKLKDSCH